jgi:hypothetical protein
MEIYMLNRLRTTSPKWFDERGYFTGKNVMDVANCICEITGFPREKMEAVKVDSYVYVFFAHNHPVTGIGLYKLKMKANVIYVLREEHFQPVIDVIKEYYI